MADAAICAYFAENGIRPPDKIVTSTDLDPASRKMDGILHPLNEIETGSYAWFGVSYSDGTLLDVFYVGQSKSLPHHLDSLWCDDTFFQTYIFEQWERHEDFLAMVAVWHNEPALDEIELLARLDPPLNARWPNLMDADLTPFEAFFLECLGEEDTALPSLVLMIKWRMENNLYPSLLIDAIVQYDSQNDEHEYDIFQTYAFMKFWAALGIGAAMIAKIHCKTVATGNPEIDFAALGKELSNLPNFALTGTPAAPSITWKKPLHIRQRATGGSREEAPTHEMEIPPYYAPLSIGYIQATKSLAQISENFALARWPTGSKTILLIHRTNHPDYWQV